nr:MAG TPA: hypothetical protein [Caudoviricetes sp.]
MLNLAKNLNYRANAHILACESRVTQVGKLISKSYCCS